MGSIPGQSPLQIGSSGWVGVPQGMEPQNREFEGLGMEVAS